MLYVAFAKTKPEHAGENLTEKSRTWWNEGGCPKGLTFHSIVGTIGSTPNILVLEADEVSTISRFVNYWYEMEIVIHPATDLAAAYRAQGMNVPAP